MYATINTVQGIYAARALWQAQRRQHKTAQIVKASGGNPARAWYSVKVN